MKLTQKIKDKIDNWFKSRTPEEVYEIGKKYGMTDNPKCICETGGAGYCHIHHTDTL